MRLESAVVRSQGTIQSVTLMKRNKSKRVWLPMEWMPCYRNHFIFVSACVC